MRFPLVLSCKWLGRGQVLPPSQAGVGSAGSGGGGRGSGGRARAAGGGRRAHGRADTAGREPHQRRCTFRGRRVLAEPR
jgi:hypothetical protein